MGKIGFQGDSKGLTGLDWTGFLTEFTEWAEWMNWPLVVG
jgi:hypothetical protein